MHRVEEVKNVDHFIRLQIRPCVCHFRPSMGRIPASISSNHGTISAPFPLLVCHAIHRLPMGRIHQNSSFNSPIPRPDPLRLPGLSHFSQFRLICMRFIHGLLCMFATWQACRISSLVATSSNHDAT
ncbi:hypothetical protein RJT34_24891 [Clitoria ternatea]|uniref:Uncharacterized protein n=1 Tax=Clitoria ternatea TaxID=43366 RepID=A0AAN9IGC4_CLITE